MFEYNGNKDFESKIEMVSNEIRKLYKDISIEDSIKIAALEEEITTEFNRNMYFKRLYNILLIVQNNQTLFNKVFIDLKKSYAYYKLNPDEDEFFLDKMIIEITKFVNNERINFPMISELKS